MSHLKILSYLIVLLGLDEAFGVKIVNLEHVEGQIYDEDCVLETETERIQIAFVVDNTWTNGPFVEKLADSTNAMMNQLNSIHNGTEFALTTHANWPQSAFTRDGHELAEGCYDRVLTFTTDLEAIQSAASNVTFLYGPYANGEPEENGVSAVAFCAADEQLGWIREIYDRNGRRIHRFIVLVTDEWSRFDLPIPGSRKGFRGDGSDTCETSLPPSLEKLKDILEEKDISIIGAYFIQNSVHDRYVTEFNDAGFGYRHCFSDLTFEDEEHFARDLSELVYHCVKKFLRCVYLDPPGAYNTLGL